MNLCCLKINYTLVLPVISDIINNTIKIKNKTLAIPAAPAAIPPKPNIPAIIARIIKITVHRNIIIEFIVRNYD